MRRSENNCPDCTLLPLYRPKESNLGWQAWQASTFIHHAICLLFKINLILFLEQPTDWPGSLSWCQVVSVLRKNQHFRRWFLNCPRDTVFSSLIFPTAKLCPSSHGLVYAIRVCFKKVKLSILVQVIQPEAGKLAEILGYPGETYRSYKFRYMMQSWALPGSVNFIGSRESQGYFWKLQLMVALSKHT